MCAFFFDSAFVLIAIIVIIYKFIDYLSSCQNSKYKLCFHLPQKMIYKLHKLSRFRTFQNQLLVHFVQKLADDESCPNQAKIHQINFQIHFCSRPTFCKNPHNHQHFAIKYSPTSPRSGVHITSYIKSSLLVRIDCVHPCMWLSSLICLSHHNFFL